MNKQCTKSNDSMPLSMIDACILINVLTIMVFQSVAGELHKFFIPSNTLKWLKGWAVIDLVFQEFMVDFCWQFVTYFSENDIPKRVYASPPKPLS